MASYESFVLLALIASGLYYLLFSSKRKFKYPPGPAGIPFLNGIYTVGPRPYLDFQEWAKQYGPIVRTKFGFTDAIIIHDAKLLREALNDPAFNGVPNTPVLHAFSDRKRGIQGGEGQEWLEQRRFALRTLRDFGFGRKSMENFIMDEVNEFLKWIKKNDGIPISVNRRLVLATVSSLWTLINGERQSHDDEILENINNKAFAVFRDGLELQTKSILAMFPQLTDIFPKMFFPAYYQLERSMKPFIQIFKDAIDFHIKNPVDEKHPRDFIDVYLAEVNRTTDPSSTFYKDTGHESLKVVLFQLYGAAISTTSSILNWTVLYLAKFPKIQEKLQVELDLVIGRNRPPALSDRPRLPFAEALLLEVFRMSTFLPLGLFHETMEDCTLGGFDVKKGSIVIANVYSINYNERIWGDPNIFRPERFLSPNGTKVLKPEEFTPFGTGKRQCLGELLARDTLFLFLTNIFHRFNVSLDPFANDVTLEAKPGFLRDAHDFTVVMTERPH